MSDYYFELQEKTNLMQQYQGNPVGETAEAFAASNADAEIVNDEPEYYPDLVIRNQSSAPTAEIEGVTYTASIIVGTHPTKRPR